MSKKRRREDIDSSLRTSRFAALGFYCSTHINRTDHSSHYICEPQIIHEDPQTRHILPYPKKRPHDSGIKRQRIELAASQYDETNLCIARPPLSDMTDRQPETVLEKKFGGRSTGGKLDLSPCHICHRKPTEKRQLEDYADCEGCGNRTCFICVRECKGLGERLYNLHRQELPREEGNSDAMELSRYGTRGEGGDERAGPWEKGGVETHRGMICSRCCVERGTEGEVWCLGCLRTEEVA
ncbi:hypothetical protein EG329_008394 [Mollisiaceae sp. DMI_Dod_QoI]|nr:hypothetical protein EG329_008394 [Helotiales sp. DMI_Dod_QoI]